MHLPSQTIVPEDEVDPTKKHEYEPIPEDELAALKQMDKGERRAWAFRKFAEAKDMALDVLKKFLLDANPAELTKEERVWRQEALEERREINIARNKAAADRNRFEARRKKNQMTRKMKQRSRR